MRKRPVPQEDWAANIVVRSRPWKSPSCCFTVVSWHNLVHLVGKSVGNTLQWWIPTCFFFLGSIRLLLFYEFSCVRPCEPLLCSLFHFPNVLKRVFFFAVKNIYLPPPPPDTTTTLSDAIFWI